MSHGISRRGALQRLAVLVGVTTVMQTERTAHAADAPHLEPDDPTAQALAYHDDATQVDPKQFPTYKPGQMCGSCLQLQGQAGQPWRPCNLFPGRLVNAGGWCRVWVAKN